MLRQSPYFLSFMPLISPSIFSLAYDAERRILAGHWRLNADDADLYPSYERLLAAAKAHDNCRFWLLDMHLRSWQTATFTKWFTELLANQAVREVGAPIFVAYVAAEHHRADIESVATEAMLRQSARAEFYPFFFSNEATAREWLVYHQTNPEALPLVPVE
jgi:hypothetical protein